MGPRHALAAGSRLRTLLRLPRRRDRPVPTRPRARQPSGRPPRTPEEGYHLTEDLADHAIDYSEGPARLDSGQAVLPLLRARRVPRTAPGAGTFIEPLPRAVRPGLGRVARRRVRAAGRVGSAAGRARELSERPSWVPAWESLGRRRAAPLRADDGGVRRLPRRTPTPRSAGSSTSSISWARPTTPSCSS